MNGTCVNASNAVRERPARSRGDRLRHGGHRTRDLRSLRGAGHSARRRAGLGRPRPPDRRLDLPQLQPAARQGRRARGPRGARPRPPGRRDRRSPTSPRRCERRCADPDVAIVGCAGAVGVRSIAWWEGAVTWAAFTHRYDEYGGGEMPAIALGSGDDPCLRQTGEVDSIDGFVMVFSPWAVENCASTSRWGKLHGYDFDICMQARAAGKKVVTADLRVDPPSLPGADQRASRPGSRPTSSSPRSGTASFRTRVPIRDSERSAPRPRRPARGRSWSPTRCASRRSGANSSALEGELESTRAQLEATSRARGGEAGAWPRPDRHRVRPTGQPRPGPANSRPSTMQ